MDLQICVLASGSKGNSTLVASPTTTILIDAGLSARATAKRLEELDRSPADIQAICVSHEHGDHTGGLAVLHERFGIPLYANSGTIQGVGRGKNGRLAGVAWQVFTTSAPFQVGDLTILPFPVPHDAYEPVGFVIATENTSVGVATDMGVSTAVVRQHLRSCRAVVVESNHDERMVQEASRPWHLKQRILGRQGHLSNDSAAALLADIAGPDLDQVFLAHISSDCNTEELALHTARKRLEQDGHGHVRVSPTFGDRSSEMWPG